MSLSRAALLLVGGLALWPWGAAGGGADGKRAPLPAGAVARIGSTRLAHGGPVECLALAPDGKTLASTGRDGTLRVWDLRSGGEARRLALPGPKHVQQLAFSPDG